VATPGRGAPAFLRLRRRGRITPADIAFSPLMQPGDTLDFKVDCVLDDWETTVVWVTWTAPPIRRRRERTSQKFLIAKHLNLSDAMRERMKKLKEHESDGG
jgi:hypothetical protein